MRQKQKDFATIVGSRSRASEILARKRGLTIEMTRAIHEHLKIPAELLIAHPRDRDVDPEDLDWSKFPVREMKKRGWLDSDLAQGKTGEDLVRSFFARTSAHHAPVLLRKTLTGVQNHALHGLNAPLILAGVIVGARRRRCGARGVR